MMERLREKTDTFAELFTWLAIVIGLATIGYSFFEEHGLWDAFWWASVTGGTVGYGDEYPITVGGRIVAIAFMAFMAIWMCVFTARLASYMIVNNDAWTNEEQEQIKRDLQDIRAHFKI